MNIERAVAQGCVVVFVGLLAGSGRLTVKVGQSKKVLKIAGQGA